MQVYTARRTEKIKGMPLGEEQLTMSRTAAQSCVERGYYFQVIAGMDACSAPTRPFPGSASECEEETVVFCSKKATA